jgi:hypothetical protein
MPERLLIFCIKHRNPEAEIQLSNHAIHVLCFPLVAQTIDGALNPAQLVIFQDPAFLCPPLVTAGCVRQCRLNTIAERHLDAA